MLETIKYIQVNTTEAEKWGQLAEEATELAQAALKMQRLCLQYNKPRKSMDECRAAVIEEHADLALCFEVLGWNDKTTRRQIMAEKANRWANWLTAVKQKVGELL